MTPGAPATMYDYFLISPVRKITEKTQNAISEWVRATEAGGKRVYWPIRDTDQDDSTGLRICRDTLRAIEESGIIAVWWDETSEGRLFDFGMAFALGKPFLVVNLIRPEPTDHKSYRNVLLGLAQ